MLAALFLIGTSIAVGSLLDMGMEDGDDAIGDEAFGSNTAGVGLDLLDEGDVETLVGDTPDVVSLVSKGPSVSTLVSDAPGSIAMIGEGVAGAFGLDAPDVLSPIGEEGELEGSWLDVAEASELEAVVSDADVPEGGQILEWTSTQDPVEITDFVPGEDILSITIIAEQGIDGVDVEIAPSADGLDGEVRANDQLIAVIRGAPDIEPDAFQFDLVDAGTDEDPSTGSTAPASASEPEASDAERAGGDPDQSEDGHPGNGKGHAYGHDKSGGGKGNAYAYGHDKSSDAPSNAGKAKGHSKG